jgi:CRP/FNR family transcriptional regulator, cyclic AMP receptor protein
MYMALWYDLNNGPRHSDYSSGNAAPHLVWDAKGSAKRMHSPYGFDLAENCLVCQLRSEKFFCNLPGPALKMLDQIKQVTAYPKGAVLFTEGQSPRGVFILCRGRVKMSITSREGKVLILKLAQAGEVLGLNASILNKPYEATAETLYPCQLDFIRREDFLRFLKEYGDVCLRAAQHVGQNCDSAYDQIRSLGLSHSAPEKLAKLLLDLSAEGVHQKPEKSVKLALTHEEIAQLIGTSRETVTRLFSEFKKKKVAELKGATLTIFNRDALSNLVLS